MDRSGEIVCVTCFFFRRHIGKMRRLDGRGQDTGVREFILSPCGEVKAISIRAKKA